MASDISAHFRVILDEPADLLLQFEAAAMPGQSILSADTRMSEVLHLARVPAHGTIGERIWLRAQGELEVHYTASVAIDRARPDLASLASIAPHRLPGATVEYLFDSRYCPAGRLEGFVAAEFGQYSGGARIAAMRDWVAAHIAYVSGSSDASTTAIDTFVERRGVCRDFAHVMIALARASAIPARFVSCYAPGVDPPDFHALAEVFLADPNATEGGSWQAVDATLMADPAEIVTIGIGRDAADVSFLTSFGPCTLDDKRISVRSAHEHGAHKALAPRTAATQHAKRSGSG